MPRSLKIYTIWTANCFPFAEVLNAVHSPRHIRQGNIYIVAPSKAAAIRQIEAQKFMNANVRSEHLMFASGNTVDALRAAGFLTEEGEVIAQRLNGVQVAKRQPDGRFEYIGEVQQEKVTDRGWVGVFVPAVQPKTGRITWTTTPDAARKHGYLCAEFGAVGDAMPFSIFRAGNELGGYSYELYSALNAPGEEITGPFTTAQEVKDEAERVLAEFLDSAGLTWKDSE